MRVDVIVIGAGLAGLSAACEIASQSRATVVIVERQVIGSNNPTPMTFADVPARYDLEDCLLGRYRSFVFHSPLGNASRHAFDTTQLVALGYRQACIKLLDRASTAGNVWEYRAAAHTLVRQEHRTYAQGGEWLVGLNDGQELQAPLVIDASGRGLFASRRLGLPRPKTYSHCFGARLSNCQIPDPTESYFLAPYEAYGNGGGWLYPLDHGQASFGYATLGDSLTFPGGVVKTNFKCALAEFEPYSTWLRDAHISHIEAGSIPIYPLRRFVYDGLLITGDAAGQATIWSCMGSEAALEAGRLAGDAALGALKKGDFSSRSLEKYQRAWDERHRRTYRHNAWIAPVVWSMPAQIWNQQIPRVQQLTPEQMLARLRVNWPVPSVTQAAFVRAYDLAGRTRRGLVSRVRRLVGGRLGKMPGTA